MRFGAYSNIRDMEALDFGCLTFGFSDAAEGFRSIDLPFEFQVFSGSYEEVCQFADAHKTGASAAIVITDAAGGENQFIRNVSEKLSCPVVGGGAARQGGSVGNGLFSGKGEADICLLTGDLSLHAEYKNIHKHVIEECSLELEGSRILKKVNGMDARKYLQQKKAELGFASGDFEHVTFSTPEGINTHLDERDGILYAGSDMEEKMLLRYVAADEVQEQIEEFYKEKPDSLVFGCAGLKAITPKTFSSNSMGLFLFGEICVQGDHSRFGNLMLSRLYL